MGLRIHRTEKNIYQLYLKDIVLAETSNFSELMGKAQTYAKKFQKKLFVSQASISDWYVGFPTEVSLSPEVFYDPFFMVKAAQEIEYKFIEGPFSTKEKALEASFKISGQSAKERES